MFTATKGNDREFSSKTRPFPFFPRRSAWNFDSCFHQKSANQLRIPKNSALLTIVLPGHGVTGQTKMLYTALCFLILTLLVKFERAERPRAFRRELVFEQN